jgi:hypothetical protein
MPSGETYSILASGVTTTTSYTASSLTADVVNTFKVTARNLNTSHNASQTLVMVIITIWLPRPRNYKNNKVPSHHPTPTLKIISSKTAKTRNPESVRSRISLLLAIQAEAKLKLMCTKEPTAAAALKETLCPGRLR